jgi:5-formyltetrahydrofolate cyclo-ligase
MRARRRALAPEARERAGREVARRLRACPEWQAARRVALYVALPDELPTAALLRAVLDESRPLLLPRIAAGCLEFARVTTPATLRPGAFGIAEPDPEVTATALRSGDLVLVPGMAFDRRGGRLGRGGGWYDRALSSAVAGLQVFGLGFAFQLVDRVPLEPHDRAVDAVVTDAELWRPPPRELPADPG